ncbi:aromatic amino acid aminotransferase 2 [[Candida] railenensis]|uniref:Aromatic amino acid aminotransferase 2 n=1 Tax=[Candida] railenensis TaxID=45579 RepID=A0A9P0VW20_9ASCO|nr:aromatic amino acid aminotransferase 2 [[Candida] railenensis]
MTANNSFVHENLISKRASKRSNARTSSAATEDAPAGFEPHPKPLALHRGMPNAGFFPIDSIDVNLVEYPFQKSLSIPITNASVESFFPDEKSVSRTNTVTIKKVDDPEYVDISTALQYGSVAGIPQLLQFTQEFINRVHKPAFEDWDTVITSGAGDGLIKAANLLLDAGDVILVEEFTFTPFLENIEDVGGIPVPIKLNLDKDSGKELGLDVEYLSDLLANWETEKPGLPFPKALYVIPSGQNPIGTTQSIETRKKVYKLAEKYDFAIIEDDVYGYLTLRPFQKPASIFKLNDFLEVDDFIANHITPSYLTIDKSGRVIRIETFSKLFAPGLRLGFIVAHKRVTTVIKNYASDVTRSASGTSQLIVQNVIAKKFGGVDGWLQWILKLRITYSHRKDLLLNQIFESAAYKKGFLEVIDPTAGMFVSVFIKLAKGVDAQAKLKLLNYKFKNFGVGVIPGITRTVDKKFSEDRSNFYRLTFAPAEDDNEITEAGQRFVEAVEDFFEKGLEY